MIRSIAANVLLQLLAWLCEDHVPYFGVTPPTCALCQRRIPTALAGTEED